MNILETLDEELKGKDWILEEKARHLYIRSCELFSYDSRYDFCDTEKQEQIRNRVIDLENLEDNFIVCTSHAREIVSEIMRKLLGIETELKGALHQWTKLKINKQNIIKADVTATSDLTRVKMKLTTRGYRTLMRDYLFPEKLEKIDQKIAYIKDYYEDIQIKREQEELLKNFCLEKCSEDSINVSFLIKQLFYNYENGTESDDFILFQWQTIQKLFNRYQTLQAFTDAEFCIYYLENKITQKKIKWKQNTVSLYQIGENQHWDFINLYPVKLKKDTAYFMLKQEQEGNCFTEISKEDALHYTKHMNGKNKDLILGKNYECFGIIR